MRHPRIKLIVVIFAMVIAAAFFVHTLDAAMYTPGSTGTLNTKTNLALGKTAHENGTSTMKVAAVKPKPSYPAKLIIPSINVDAPVQMVGVTAGGAIGTPDSFFKTGWYAGGTVPGAAGTAVIDGHVDNGLGLAGVFKQLSDVKVGDTVHVVTNAGKTITFKVIATHAYDYSKTPANALFGPPSSVVAISPNMSFLNLITCTGDWLPAQKTYNQRLIVTAMLVR